MTTNGRLCPKVRHRDIHLMFVIVLLIRQFERLPRPMGPTLPIKSLIIQNNIMDIRI